ncbi:hypothetical protein RFI_10318 [Reticulomyxa filosa]|uniref:Uncharacterized protein n=1 Tax=Reticulomyxa filosa TaxID=46433 RepID=X6NN45_RETFI|nr:hypothetical protein RFI_10318 [Reticulomyxa filosa]|eukprot:ETO26817.1 hypothetical protein RFI_10318 [Reticulomyxa filosa]
MLSERYKQKCVLRPNKESFETSSIPLLNWIDNNGNGNKNTWNMCWPDTTSCSFSSNTFVTENCTTDAVLSKDREISVLKDQIAWFQLENTRLKYVNEEMSRHYCQLYQSYLTTQQQQSNNGTLLPKCTIENFETLQLLTKENAELKQQLQQSSKRIEEIQSQCTQKPLLTDNLHDKQTPKQSWDEKTEVPQADWMDLDLPLTHSVANEPEDNTFGDFVNAYGERNFDLMFDMEN